jgi:hypothetical protein
MVLLSSAGSYRLLGFKQLFGKPAAAVSWREDQP